MHRARTLEWAAYSVIWRHEATQQLTGWPAYGCPEKRGGKCQLHACPSEESGVPIYIATWFFTALKVFIYSRNCIFRGIL